MSGHRIIKIAAKVTLAAASIGILAAYSCGCTAEYVGYIIREKLYKTEETAAESAVIKVEYEDESEKTFVFIESPNVIEAEGPEIKVKEEENTMNVVRPDYMPGITNQTSYEVDASLMERETVKLEKCDDVQVLIVHTHSSECYAADEAAGFSGGENDRTLNSKYNVIRVGDELAEYLTKEGIGVIHDRSLNDYPSYNGSYSRMLKIINAYMEKYPTIKMVLDIHRDAIYYRDGTAYAAVLETEKERAAQIMLVVGTNEGGLSHDNWQDNMAFAMKLQRRADTLYPGLMRDINLRKERFNQHTTPASLIVEVGTTGNTLTEALCGVRYFAQVLAEEVE